VNDVCFLLEFYFNKILVEFKKSDQKQVDWVTFYNGFLKELTVFIKKYHTTGLAWNPRGGDASSFSGAAAAAPAAARGGPPPPPPPPSAPLAAADTGKKDGPNPTALFAELNKGAAVTSGLKKVTKDMKTSNRTDKTSVVPSTESKEPKAKPAVGAGAQKKGTPKFELVGNKWIVEWQDGKKDIEIKETEPKQTVYIYKCDNSVVKVTGKINTILLDSCKRVAVVFESAVSGCEIVNSNSVEIQITGKVPSIAIDKTSGIQLYLSKDGLGAEIVTSKSDQMNALIPDPAGGVDPIEIPIPEQYKTIIKDNKLITTCVEHKG